MYDLYDSDPAYDQDDPRSSGPQAEDMAGSQEPPEPDEDDEPEPLDMEQIVEAIDCIEDKWVVGFLKEALAERNSLREQLAYWRGLSMETVYVVAYGGERHPNRCGALTPCADGAEAERLAAAGATATAYMRVRTLHPWVEYGEATAPF